MVAFCSELDTVYLEATENASVAAVSRPQLTLASTIAHGGDVNPIDSIAGRHAQCKIQPASPATHGSAGTQRRARCSTTPACPKTPRPNELEADSSLPDAV